MNKRRRQQICLSLASALFAGLAILVLHFLLGPDDTFFSILGTINGALVIALIVDLFNRHTDPRNAKRPPDGP